MHCVMFELNDKSLHTVCEQLNMLTLQMILSETLCPTNKPYINYQIYNLNKKFKN